MSTQAITCFVAVCDVCGDQMPDMDGGTPHFKSGADAINAAPDYDWTVVADKRLVCGDPDTAHEKAVRGWRA